MKAARLQVRSLIAALILLTLTSLAARADEGANFLADLHQFRLSNYLALDAYYRFSATGDTDTLNEIVEAINNANSRMNTLNESTAGVLDKDRLEALNQEFDKYKSLMRNNINDVRNTGYPDLRLTLDMANQASTMNGLATELYSEAIGSGQTEVDPRVEAARSAAVTMAQMMEKYSARSNTSVSQNFQGSETDIPLDEQARVFDRLLSEVLAGNPTGSLKTTLDDINAKWQFIRGSYINYNENNVSYVIGRYSKGILSGLNTAIGLMQENA